jgi:hypothetical protein
MEFILNFIKSFFIVLFWVSLLVIWGIIGYQITSFFCGFLDLDLNYLGHYKTLGTLIWTFIGFIAFLEAV